MDKKHFEKLNTGCEKCPICLIVIIFLCFFTLSTSAQSLKTAQNAEVPGDLSLADLFNMKITSASLRPQELREVPATTYIVTEKDFKRYGYRDIKDILRNAPGIEYSYPNSHLFGGQRGFSSFWELTKLMINGREVNSLASSALFVINQFPLTGVKRVEIIQGPASVLYGPEAFSGVINIVTKDVDTDTSKSELTAIGGGGDKSSWNISGAFHNATKKGDLSIAVNGYADCSKEPDYTDFLKTSEYSKINQQTRTYLLVHGDHYRDNDRNLNLNSNLVYSPGPNFEITGGALYLRGETGGGIEAAQLSYRNGNIISEQMHVYAGSDYRFTSVPVKSSLSYHFVLDNFYARFQNSLDIGDNPPPIAASNFEKNKLNVLNFQTDYTPSFTDNYFIIGAGMRNTKLGEPAFTGISLADTSPFQPVSLVGRYLYPPAGYFTFLRPYLDQKRRYIYAQDQQNIWDKKIQITAGIRYDYNSIYGDVLDIRSGLLLRPITNYTIKVLFGQGFREPTIFELSNNPDLSPARINSHEVSLLFTPIKQISGQIAYFQNRAHKLIETRRSADGAYFQLSNVGEKRVAGVETNIRYHLGSVGGDIWHCYEYSLDSKPILGAPDNKLGFGGYYTYHDHLSLTLRAKYTTKAEGLVLETDGTQRTMFLPYYFNLDLNLLAHDLLFAGVNWDVSFSIYNITGRKNYYSNTIGSNPHRYLAEGREFFGKLTIYY